MHTGNPSIQEAKAGGLKVLGQLELPRESLFPLKARAGV